MIILSLALGALWFICFRHLSAEWSYNEQYSYGWFVPFFALYLFWLRWEDRPQPYPAPEARRSNQAPGRNSLGIATIIASTIAIGALLLLLPVRLIEIANPDWRPVSWVHTLAAVAITLCVVWSIGGRPWLRHFAFPIVFVLVSVPWISAIEAPIVQGLMPTLASIATEVLSLFGIPAEVQGNLVRINGGVVGVNEACSGVRSLQTSIMIGLLFGELKRLRAMQRVLLLVGAVAIAFIANCGRALFLVWIASSRGLTAVEKWHDIAGYTIVGLVFAGCLGITALLARSSNVEKEAARNRARENGAANFSFRNSTFYFAAALCWLLVVEGGVEWWYRSHEKNLPRTAQWSVRWPDKAPDFREIHIDDRVRAVLHFDKGKGATWKRSNDRSDDLNSAASGQAVSLLYFFRWEPGHNSALLANAHRPDVCLPATGWQRTEDLGVHDYQISPDLTVPFRHFVFTRETAGRSQHAHAFYCVWEDRVRAGTPQRGSGTMGGEPSAWTRNERLEAVREGRRHLGQQVIEYLVLEPRETNAVTAEQDFAGQVPHLIQPAPRS